MEPEVLATLGEDFVAFLFRVGKLANTIIALSPINIKKIVRKVIIIYCTFYREITQNYSIWYILRAKSIFCCLRPYFCCVIKK